MPLSITTECWDTWGAVMENLADNFEFPARTFETINGYLTIFTGPGSTLRVNTEMWKFVLDVIRQGESIVDISPSPYSPRRARVPIPVQVGLLRGPAASTERT